MEQKALFALVIDDNRQTANSLCKLLDMLGIQAKPAYGPRAAMLAVEDKIPDIVLLDIHMPGVDGFEVLSYFQRLPDFKQVHFIVVTSDDQPETRERALRKGARAVIVKPVSLEELESQLQKFGAI